VDPKKGGTGAQGDVKNGHRMPMLAMIKGRGRDKRGVFSNKRSGMTRLKKAGD